MTTTAPALNKALFLDRDGTIIYDKNYLSDPAGVELIPGARDALARALRLGYRLYLITNQSGIGRGYHTLDDAHRCNARMEQLLALAQPVSAPASASAPAPLFAGICIAPEAPEQPSLYRKPSPRYIHEMIARDHLDPAQSWMVGDREADIDTGLAANIRSAALCTGKRSRADWAAIANPAYRNVPVFDDLAAFARTLA